MAKGTIMDRLFHGKPDAKEVTIRAKKPVVHLAAGRLFIGRTPGRFIDVKGQPSGDELSIKESLDTLGANQAAVKIFPLAATPGSYWLYFALFSTCKQTPGVRPLKQYIKFLKDKFGRNNAGVGYRVLFSKRKLKRVKERARNVHDIRLRIPDDKERKEVIDERILRRLDTLIRGKWNKPNYQHLARDFRHAWRRQSPVLRRHNHAILVKNKAPTGLRDTALMRVYAGYWLIRSLYGIDIRSGGNDDQERESKELKTNTKLIRKSAKIALRYLGMLERRTGERFDNMIELCEEAERTGEPPLINEYYRRQAEGRRVLNGFRLTRFWQVLNQLNLAARGRG